jgi:hypothetical protein
VASSDGTLWSLQPRVVEAARNHDGHAAATITRDSLLSAMARIEETLNVPTGASSDPLATERSSR